MSQPIHNVKDSKLFPVVIEDFARPINWRKHKVGLGNVGGHWWYLTFQQVFRDQMSTLNLAICYDDNWRKSKSLEVHYGFYIPSRHPTLSRFDQSRANLEPNALIGNEESFLLSELLDENKGYMNDGDLTIQIEIRVDVIIDKEGVRRFNFYDPFEGCFTLTNGDDKYYLCKKLISHHSAFFADEISNGKSKFKVHVINDDLLKTFLQLLYGVPLRIDSLSTLSAVIQLAYWFGANNVLQYCSIELKNHKWWHAPIHRLPINRVETLIRTVESVEQFREYTGVMIHYLDQMNSALLKTIVKKFFLFASDNDCNDKITVPE